LPPAPFLNLAAAVALMALPFAAWLS